MCALALGIVADLVRLALGSVAAVNLLAKEAVRGTGETAPIADAAGGLLEPSALTDSWMVAY